MKRLLQFLGKHKLLISGSFYFVLMLFFLMVFTVGNRFIPDVYHPASATCGFAVGVGFYGLFDVVIGYSDSKIKATEENRQSKTQ